jgi:anti-sigma regulatory factor (Ser/Thr protein kinase)
MAVGNVNALMAEHHATPPESAQSSCAIGAGAPAGSGSFRHEMLFYSDGDRGFLRGTLELVTRAIASEAAVLVAVGAAQATALTEALGDDSEHVRFADMRRLGRNPARIIPVWQEFVREHSRCDGGLLGIGEPVWPGRSAAELSECERHEALLNLAFEDGPAWHLLCPYDLDGLDDHVIEAARHTHPVLAFDGVSHENHGYVPTREPPRPFDGVLPAPSGPVAELAFASMDLAELRRRISGWAGEQALAVEGIEELVLAIDELATNSIRHGGGAGTLRYWREADMLLCEVQDSGRIEAPLLGRSSPGLQAHSGRGVWIVNQLCDLVQIRSGPAGSIVRVQKSLH